MYKILVGSPIRQKSAILKEFLNSLEELDKTNIKLDFFFVDDNTDQNSSKLLKEFSKKNVTILKSGKELFADVKDEYVCDKFSHSWKRGLIEKITTYKDFIIDYARENKYDYLFFIDSDIVLHKKTIQQLVSRQMDIVSNVFWTQWYPNASLEPQVWLQDVNNCYITNWDKEHTLLQKKQEQIDFFTKLRFPGLFEVGGLGACTLISRKAIEQGVKFKLIENLSFWGEDRHFCIRAQALGIKLYVDTTLPAYHIYREEYLNRVDEFKKDGFKFDMCQTYGESTGGSQSGLKRKIIKALKLLKNHYILRKINKFDSKRIVDNNKIVLSMVVKNESGRYLERVLNSVKNCIDAVLIIDDASTDNTVEICENCLKDIEHKIIINKKSMFKHEYKLRKKQWKETLKFNPGWILSLDADEVVEDAFKDKLDELVKINNIDVYNFRLFDMWNETDYREDEYWNAHNSHMTFLIRYQPKYKYKFKCTNQHCGRLPKNLRFLRNANVDVRIKHFGWSREEDRIAKCDRYMKLDKDGKYGIIEQYKSILDKDVNLKRFE